MMAAVGSCNVVAVPPGDTGPGNLPVEEAVGCYHRSAGGMHLGVDCYRVAGAVC